ncbi:MAG: protein kinase domain-containing protein, partial [Planctomycetota bacterium]
MPESQLGPYRLLAELGSGGMGTVHAAEVVEAVPGLEAGSRVAIKVVHPHLLSTSGFFKRFLREAELGRKVIHENVVRTFDVDATEFEGKVVHYMVLEYVEGRSLRDLLKDLGTIPEGLLREIALQTTAGLAAIHEAGIVHRDLKPENVLITDDHEVRIMDLGVAKLQEASIAITKEGQFAGSLLYAAPEQFGPEEVGPAADLYALGVMLHELATGDNPFRRDDTAAVIDAQLRFRPPRIEDTSSETTGFFSELVATLLAKRPGDRFESAQVLHSVLAEAERSPWWVEIAPKLRADVAHLPKIRVRRTTELHGRDDTLETLNAAWSRARDGEGNTVFLEGEAGIGKTRLLDAFVRGLDDSDVHVLYGSYPPSGGLGGLSDAVLGKFGEADLAGAVAPYLKVTPALVPAFVALVKHESPPTGSEPLQGEALLAMTVHLMQALAEEKPLIWMAEDLHFAPKESRDGVLALARAVEGHRVLLVTTARPGVPDDELAHFDRLENYQRLKLGRLGAREIAELLEDAFKSEALAEKLGMKIARKSDGVPFFILEMIRGLEEGHFIRKGPDGTYVQTQLIENIDVPSAVKGLIEGRLHGLAREQRAILDVGAVQGLYFDADLVADVLEEKTVRVLQEVAEIERHLGLVRGEAGAVRFDQNQIQEVVYQELIPDLRAEYHTLVADAIRRRSATGSGGEDAVRLAAHYLRGRRPEKGVPYLVTALDHLEELHRNDEAIELAALALEKDGLLEGAERAELLVRKAARHDLRADRDDERAALDEALELAEADGDPALQAKVRIGLGWLMERIADHAAAQAQLEQALDLARAAGDESLERRATGNLGNVLWGLGRYDAARVQYESALALAHRIGDRQGEAVATGNLGNVYWSRGLIKEAHAHHERFLALSREIGYRQGEANATGNLGVAFLNLGHTEDALVHIEKSLAL